jgi:hypothetical protein
MIIKINNENYTVKPKKFANYTLKGLIVTNEYTGVYREFPYYTKAAKFVGTYSTYQDI